MCVCACVCVCVCRSAALCLASPRHLSLSTAMQLLVLRHRPIVLMFDWSGKGPRLSSSICLGAWSVNSHYDTLTLTRSVCLSVCQFGCLSVCLSVCQFVCLSSLLWHWRLLHVFVIAILLFSHDYK